MRRPGGTHGWIEVMGLGAYLLVWAPRDYMVRYPGTATVLHPWLVALYVASSTIPVLGILLGLAARSVQRRWRRRAANDAS